MSAKANVMRPATFRSFRLPKPEQIRPVVWVDRKDTPKELLAAEADTQGWDVVSAVRLSQVNAAIEATGVSPDGFNLAVDKNWEINGRFSPWRMTRGGSGSIVFLRAPIPSASMIFQGKTTPIENATAIIQVKLLYLPHELPEPDPTLGDPNELHTDVRARSGDDPAVVIQRIDWGTLPVGEMEKALFQSALAQWFNANLGLFNYVFAVVSLNQIAKAPQFQWLKPTYTSYAYYDGPSSDKSEDVAYFGALTMNGRSPDGLANQLPASAIPQDQGAALLIGMRLFMENMLLPGAQGAFPGSSSSDFVISNGNTSVQLARDLDMEKVRVGLIDYQPVAQEFTMQIIGDEIQTRTKVHINISPGIDAYVLNECYYRIKLVNKPEGGQTLSWEESRPAKSEHYTVTETWVTVTEAIVSIIGAVALGVAGKILTGVVRVVVMVIIAVVAGIAAATPAIIAKVISDGAAKELPSISQMLGELLAPLEWPNTSGFELSTAELNGSLQLGGQFRAAP